MEVEVDQGLDLPFAPLPDPSEHDAPTLKRQRRDHDLLGHAEVVDGCTATTAFQQAFDDDKLCQPMAVWLMPRQVDLHHLDSLDVEALEGRIKDVEADFDIAFPRFKDVKDKVLGLALVQFKPEKTLAELTPHNIEEGLQCCSVF